MRHRFTTLTILLLACVALHAQELLRLEDCRAKALENNKQLQIAQQKIEAAKYQKRSAVANFLPDISFNGGYMYNEKNLMLIDPSHLPPLLDVLIPRNLYTLDIQHVYGGAFTLSQPIFMGGKIMAYNKIMDYSVELARSKQTLATQEVIVRTDEVYWQIVSLTYKKELAESFVGLLKKLEADVQILISEGFATKSDELTVAVKLNEAELTLRKVENGIALSKMLLCQICGMELDSNFRLADEELLEEADPDEVLPLSAEQAMENRVELSSLELARRIYKKKEQIEISKMLPSVAVMGNYIATNPNSFNGFKNELAGMWNVGVVVRVPIFHFGKRYNELRAAKVETRIIELERDEAKEKIELQIKQAYFKMNEAEQHLNATTKNMEKADDNLQHANDGFKEGVMTATNVMEAQTAWIKAHADRIDAAIESKLCHLYLRKAVGVLR